MSYFKEVSGRSGVKRTAAGEIEIGMPKRIWTAGVSEAEHPGEGERTVGEGEREKETWLKWCTGSERRQVESEGREERGKGGHEGHGCMRREETDERDMKGEWRRRLSRKKKSKSEAARGAWDGRFFVFFFPLHLLCL